MTRDAALVLSSGGAKGPFQLGAMCRLEEKGYRWIATSGSSIGAIHAAFAAMGERATAERLWDEVTPQRVFGSRGKFSIAARLIAEKSSMYGNEGVWEVIKLIDPAKMTIDCLVGAVSQISGQFVSFRKDHPDFLRAIAASAALPLVFPPVDVSEEHKSMIDGAVRNVVPLSWVFPYQPQEIVIINCSSDAALAIPHPPKRALGIIHRSVEIMMHEIFHNDIGRVQQINDLVRQAREQGATLRNSAGRELREFNLTLIEPDFRLGNNVQYTRDHAKRAYEAGYEKASKVVP